MKVNQTDLEVALTRCKDSFIWAAIFSMFINILQLVPTIYMLQLYDRVVPTGNHSTLLMLTLNYVGFVFNLRCPGMGTFTDIS